VFWARRFCAAWRRSFRSLVASGLLCALFVGTVGLPVWPRPVKDRSRPFPCQNSPCGCNDAERCWRACCCHTNAEKLAWARQHGVTPPHYVVEAARAVLPANSTCCGTPQDPIVAPGPLPSDVAGARPGADSTGGDALDAENNRIGIAIVLVESYRQCRGLAPLWILLFQVVVGAPETPKLPLPAPGEWLPTRSERHDSSPGEPATPPPREIANGG